MKIAVGSTNPIKIAAVRAVTTKVWPTAEVQGISVPSRVRAMPMSDDECITGARNRATAAQRALDADLGLGLEGGAHQIDDRLFLIGWVVAIDNSGQESIACAARMPLPPAVSQAILAGRELGPVMDELTGRPGVSQAEGAIGILTQGLMTRQQAFEMGVTYALAPWISPEWYSAGNQVADNGKSAKWR